jgi:hypothetical protein
LATSLVRQAVPIIDGIGEMVNVIPRKRLLSKNTKHLQAAFALLAAIVAYQNISISISMPTPSTSTSTSSSSPTNVEAKDTANHNTVLLPIRLCRASKLHFPEQQQQEYNTLPIRYQCAGKEYNDFGAKLWHFASNPNRVHGHHDGTWGRLPNPIPAHKTVFILGNSHTRQITHAMICQYADQITKRTHSSSHGDMSSREMFHFQNNSTLHVLINSPLVYSHKWDTLIEQAIGQSLPSLDAFVLGVFNSCETQINNNTINDNNSNSNNKPSTTNFHKAMQKASRQTKDIEFCTVDPPSPFQVTELFQGPILFVSAFSALKKSRTRKVERFIKNTTLAKARNNLYSMDSRKYIDALGMECSSNEMVFSAVPGRCGNRTEQHRCSGTMGGHSDLVAFDIVQALHSSLQ